MTKANETFTEQAKRLKLTTVQKKINFLRGKKIRILGISFGHQLGVIGDIINVGQDIYITGQQLNGVSPRVGGYIHFSEFKVITSETPKEIKENIEFLRSKQIELDEEITLEESKLTFLKETKNKVYDENEFKAYTTLSLLEDNDLSKLDKAKIIAKLIN